MTTPDKEPIPDASPAEISTVLPGQPDTNSVIALEQAGDIPAEALAVAPPTPKSLHDWGIYLTTTEDHTVIVPLSRDNGAGQVIIKQTTGTNKAGQVQNVAVLDVTLMPGQRILIAKTGHDIDIKDPSGKVTRNPRDFSNFWRGDFWGQYWAGVPGMKAVENRTKTVKNRTAHPVTFKINVLNAFVSAVQPSKLPGNGFYSGSEVVLGVGEVNPAKKRNVIFGSHFNPFALSYLVGNFFQRANDTAWKAKMTGAPDGPEDVLFIATPSRVSASEIEPNGGEIFVDLKKMVGQSENVGRSLKIHGRNLWSEMRDGATTDTVQNKLYTYKSSDEPGFVLTLDI